MPTQPYKIDGIRVPSVTTILGRFKESGGLIHWAWEQGRDGLDYRQTRDDAADAGKIAHAMVESTIRCKPFPIKPESPPAPAIEMINWKKATSSFAAFQEWSQQTKLTPLETEVSLTCRCHMVGGTLDAMMVNDKLAIGDWKTGNAVYIDHLCQLAAYGHLWTVNYPSRPIIGGYHLLRFSKVEGDFTHHFWANLDKAWRQFELLREAFDLDKELKERL